MSFNSFIFNDDHIFNQHIHPISGINLMSVIDNRYRNFAFDSQSLVVQLVSQACLIG